MRWLASALVAAASLSACAGDVPEHRRGDGVRGRVAPGAPEGPAKFVVGSPANGADQQATETVGECPESEIRRTSVSGH